MKKILLSFMLLIFLTSVYAEYEINSISTDSEPVLIKAIPVDPDPDDEVILKPAPGALPPLPPAPDYCEYYTCEDGRCVKEKCECYDECEPERCPDGLLLCDNGMCVINPDDCFDECKYYDDSGNCVYEPEKCEDYNEDGTCVEEPEECKDYNEDGECVEIPDCLIKCRDGTCVDSLKECEDQCEDGEILCMDSFCIAKEACPVPPVCECPKGYEMCDNGFCYTDLRYCDKSEKDEPVAKSSKPKEIVVVGSKATTDAVIKGSKISENDGDPDRPVVVGKTYNDKEEKPVTGPAGEEIDKDHKGEIEIVAESDPLEKEDKGLGQRISNFFKNIFN